MAHGIHRLSAAKVKTETQPGFYSDGGGLYLQISTFNASKSWVFKYTVHGRRRGMGMGSADTLTLAEARRTAERLREQVRNGIDPIEAKHAEAQAKKAALAELDKRKTFKQCAEAVITQKSEELRNAKAVAQWQSTLETYAYPFLNDGRKIDELTRHDVARVLQQETGKDKAQLWHDKPETASRLRGRIEAVFNYAKGIESFKGDNPAEFKGMLEPILGKQKKEAKENQPALSHKRIGAFMAELRQREGMSARALEFAILTAARSGEVRGATWPEIDLHAHTWTVPASRMKAGREHVVTLSDAAVKLLKALPRIVGTSLVFPAPRGGELSDMTLTQLLRRMHESDTEAGGAGWTDARTGRVAVVHGFRSTFRDWAAETGHDRDMAELALAHTVGSAVERAYRRTDMQERRRSMMADWGDYCATVANNVVALKQGAA